MAREGGRGRARGSGARSRVAHLVGDGLEDLVGVDLGVRDRLDGDGALERELRGRGVEAGSAEGAGGGRGGTTVAASVRDEGKDDREAGPFAIAARGTPTTAFTDASRASRLATPRSRRARRTPARSRASSPRPGRIPARGVTAHLEKISREGKAGSRRDAVKFRPGFGEAHLGLRDLHAVEGGGAEGAGGAGLGGHGAGREDGDGGDDGGHGCGCVMECERKRANATGAGRFFRPPRLTKRWTRA